MNDEYRIDNKRLRDAIFKVFGGKCFYTGQKVTKDNMAIDHVIPKSKGGKDSIYNYVLTTQYINSQKRAALNEEKVTTVLYLIETVYAPRIIKLLFNMPKEKYDEVQDTYNYFVKLGYNEKEIKNVKELMRITKAPKEFVSVYAAFTLADFGDPFDEVEEFINIEELELCEEILARHLSVIKKNKKRIKKEMAKRNEVMTEERKEIINHWRKQLIKDRYTEQENFGNNAIPTLKINLDKHIFI